MIKLKLSMALLLILVVGLSDLLIFTGSVSAQQIQTIPIGPQYQSPIGMPQSPVGMVPQVVSPEQPPPPRQPSLEKLSEFEQYIYRGKQ